MLKKDLIKLEIIKAISNIMRFKIMRLLQKKPTKITKIKNKLNVDRTLLSHHLSNLKKAGLITSKRDGKEFVCSITKTGQRYMEVV